MSPIRAPIRDRRFELRLSVALFARETAASSQEDGIIGWIDTALVFADVLYFFLLTAVYLYSVRS